MAFRITIIKKMSSDALENYCFEKKSCYIDYTNMDYLQCVSFDG